MGVDTHGPLCGLGSEAQWVKVRPEWIEKELARRSCLDLLMSRFGLDAALVSTPQLAKVLGRSKSTIYASVKAGRFFIPHRMVGESPMFTIDDVVSWYLSGGSGPRPDRALERERAGAAAKRDGRDARADEEESMESLDKPRRDRAVDDLVARAVKSLEGRGAEVGPLPRKRRAA